MKKSIACTLAAVLTVAIAHAEETKVEVTANDQMQFSTKSIEVKAGDTVTLTLKHIGQLPKAGMGHNLVILKTGATAAEFAPKAMTAAATEYIPQDAESKGKILAHTKLLGGGESDTITFTAPAAGTYPFLCTFPGHFAVMQGTLTVK